MPVLQRVKAKVVDEFESGTDCTVYLALKNRGTTETCQTGPLDDPGNSWARGETEFYSDFNVNYDLKCHNFQPRNNFLQFKIHLDSSCVDHLQLSLVRVSFGHLFFQWVDWNGHWFNPSSDWVNFDLQN